MAFNLSAAPGLGTARRLASPLAVRRATLASLKPVVLVFALAACGTEATPTPEPISGGATLVPGAAVTASIGPDGGELVAVDGAGGRSYRLSVPSGAFAEATEVTISPIQEIAGFPFDGRLLGGVELEPDGAVPLGPVTLEITLDAGQQAALRTAIDEGQVVAGFSYPGTSGSVAEDLGVTLAAVAEDMSTVTLTLTSFSGHGAGTGSPQRLRGRPCPTDPVGNAECEIHKILHPPGGPADPTDPAVRDQVKQVFRNWLDVLVVTIDAAAVDPAAFEAAFQEAVFWQAMATVSLDGLVSQVWSAPGDELFAEGQRLDDALYAGWQKAFNRANQACTSISRPGPGNGPGLEGIISLLRLHAQALGAGWEPPNLTGIAALLPGTFCVRLTLTAESGNPTELAEGSSGRLGFRIGDASLALESDLQLDAFQAQITATPADPALLTATGGRLGLGAFADVVAQRATPGSTTEGTFELAVRLFGSNLDYASLSVPIDITSTAGGPIACSPLQTSTNALHGQVPDSLVMDHIFVRFSEGSSCTVEIGEGDVADAILVADTDSDSTLWDAEATGSLWSEASGYGKDQSGGKHTLIATSTSSGKSYQISIEVYVSIVDDGPATTMVVQNVTITPM